MSRTPKPKIGQYRHTPGDYIAAGPNGARIPLKVRRRFPYLALVFMVSAVAGPLACAAVSLLFNSTALRIFVPRRYSELSLPPSPTLENVLFGAGVHEVALASALAGWWLWHILWKMRLPLEMQKGGMRSVLPPLLTQGLILGPVFALVVGLPIGAFGLFLRTGPAQIPWAVKPFFALISMPISAFNALFTGVVPLVLILMGLGHGALAALAVAYNWQRFPEEPDTR